MWDDGKVAIKTPTNGANLNIVTSTVGLNLYGFHGQRVNQSQAEMKNIEEKESCLC